MSKKCRRTDVDIESEVSDIEKSVYDYPFGQNVLLKKAMNSAPSTADVYVLWLNGVAQKCGRVVYKNGLKWRFTQYYNLNYDKKAQNGNYWSVSPDNRDEVLVSWQSCPVSKSRELESKLFDKYQKGPWARRRPHCDRNTCNYSFNNIKLKNIFISKSFV